ncbi:hypothetical protein [Streptomyces sp. NPDC056660]|uniref:hypothetical protein n=1 Tax=Streptomyces sp. NPDC056660 TaxID=3345897 RepID=UPI0036D1463E
MIRVDFSLPAEFQEIPLGGDFDVAWAEAVLPGEREPVATVRDDEWPSDEAAGAMRRVSCFLSDVGVVYAANCLQVFEGRLSLGSLAVAIVDYPYGRSATTAARGAVQAVLGSRGEGWSGAVVQAPAGPAAVFTGGQTQVLSAPFSSFSSDGGPGRAEVPTAQFHAMIPIPPPEAGGAGLHMCLMVFSTSRVAHWEKCYAPVAAGILRSLRFTAVDGTTVNPADRAGDAHDGGGRP